MRGEVKDAGGKILSASIFLAMAFPLCCPVPAVDGVLGHGASVLSPVLHGNGHSAALICFMIGFFPKGIQCYRDVMGHMV